MRLCTLFQDQLFADLFPPRGQPAEAPWRLALISILQFIEGLPDRQAAEAVRSRIDWKYLLGLELTDAGFDFSVLSEFRSRLIAGGAEERLFDTLLTHFKAQGWLVARGRQRTDATHVLAAIRTLNRLELVARTRHARAQHPGPGGARLAASTRWPGLVRAL
jgi:transposase